MQKIQHLFSNKTSNSDNEPAFQDCIQLQHRRLNELMTHYNSSTQSSCDDWNTEELKRTLHISNQDHMSYPIFLIKELSINNHYNKQNCKAFVEHDQNRFQLKFNGKEYPIQHIKKTDPD